MFRVNYKDTRTTPMAFTNCLYNCNFWILQKSFWDNGYRSRCATKLFSSPIFLQTNPRYHCTSSSIHTAQHISLTFCVSSVTQSINFDRSLIVGRSKKVTCDEVARELYSPSRANDIFGVNNGDLATRKL